MNDDKILSLLRSYQNDFIDMLREFVALESPSHEDKEASDKCGDFLERAFGGLGFKIERIYQDTCGDHVYGELGSGEKSALIVGHYDTVFPVGTIKSMPFYVKDGKAFGPGVLDMKGGIVMAYFAIKALIELNLMPKNKIGIFFNSDEESGSFCSSDLIVARAKEYQSALIMEPGINDINAVKTGRYGRGTYDIVALGKAAHSGSNSHLAISPIIELAHQLIRIEKMNDEVEDVTFTPTYIYGGIAGTCMVPETATFSMDVRFKTSELSEKINRQLLALEPITANSKIKVIGKIDKPVMTGDRKLYSIVKNIGVRFGLDPCEVTVGGGSDGNFTSAAGIPTLDGLGTTGEFLHNPGEYIHIDHIPQRTAMLAELLGSL